MRHIGYRRPSPAALMAFLALLIALGGTSYAAITLPANSVGTKQLKKNAVTSKKVKNRSLKAVDFASGQLPQGPKGDAGARGPQGVQGEKGDPGDPAPTPILTVRSASDVDSAQADCQIGEAALGGGATVDTAGGFLTDSEPVPNVDDVPIGWFAAAEQSSAADTNVTAWVVCAAPGE